MSAQPDVELFGEDPLPELKRFLRGKPQLADSLGERS